MQTRPPYQAGRFYPESAAGCRQMLDTLFAGADQGAQALATIVPHAGWVYSGRTAARGLAALAAAKPETIILFGAVHSPDHNTASVYATGTWQTPLGPVPIDEQLAAEIVKGGDIVADAQPHAREHSLEVEVPFLQHQLDDFRIVPIMVRPSEHAVQVGRVVAEAARKSARKVAYLASTDLTHYGPSFGFEPAGRGQEGIRWAKEVNDRRLIDLVAARDADAIVPEALSKHNACGPGAVAALLGAMEVLTPDATYQELEHTSSAEMSQEQGDTALNSVGYHAGIFPLS